MAEVKWIKITTDMFDNRKIKHLRRLPDGNNIVLIWVMLLTMAGRCNANGMIFLTENIPYTPKMLADELDFEENTVQLALQALENLGMIVTNNGYFAIAGWEEYQNIEGMEKIREQNRIRKQRQREKEKLLPNNSHVKSRDSHATDIDIDKELDIEIDKEREEKNTYKKPGKPADISLPYQSIVQYLNQMAGTNYRHTTKKTQQLIKARFQEGFTEDDFKIVIDKKVREWVQDQRFSKYLRPETLFGTKFESYLNEKAGGRNENFSEQSTKKYSDGVNF